MMFFNLVRNVCLFSFVNVYITGRYLDENQLKVAFYNEEQDHSPSHLKFFLLIFAKDKAQAQAQEGQSPKTIP